MKDFWDSMFESLDNTSELEWEKFVEDFDAHSDNIECFFSEYTYNVALKESSAKDILIYDLSCAA